MAPLLSTEETGDRLTRLVRALVALVFLQTLVPLPAFAQADPTAADVAVRDTLPNGLHVVIVPDHLAPVVTTVVDYHAGSAQETMPGLAHATEHMMFRGTPTVSAGQLADISARMGAQYNAETGNTDTIFHFTLPKQFLDLVLRIEADRMSHALMREQDWERERGAIEQEVQARASTPGASFGVEIRKRLVGGTPYEEEGLGTIDGFNAMKASDIARFYHTWYHPNNATLVIAGDVDPGAVLASVRSAFGAIASAPLPPRAAVHVKPVVADNENESITTPFGGVMLGYRLPGRNDPDWAAAEVAMNALANARGPIVALAYNGTVGFATTSSAAFPEVGYGFVLAATLPTQDSSVARDTLEAVVDKDVNDGLSDDIVADTKREMEIEDGSQTTSIESVALAWTSALQDGAASPAAESAAIANVTTADVNRVLKKYIRPSARLALTIFPNGHASAPSGGSAAESVAYEPSKQEPLPAIAAPYFAKPPTLDHPFDADADSFRLPNGLRIVTLRDSSSSMVAVRGIVDTEPQLQEPLDQHGVDSILDSLFEWGTTSLDRQAFAAAAQAIPAAIKVGSAFSATVAEPKFDAAVALLADGLLHPGLPADGFAVARQQTVQELEGTDRQVGTAQRRALQAALFPKGDPALRAASAATVAALTLDDVKAWYARAYRPDRTTIAVIGNVDPQRVRATIAKYFGAWTSAAHDPLPTYPPLPQNDPAYRSVESAGGQQTDIALAETLNLNDSNPDRLALMLGDEVLAHESFASLLFKDLRAQTGYVYSLDSTLDIGKTRSTYSFRLATDPQRANDAVDLLRKDVEKVQHVLLSEDDLNRAKASLVESGVLSAASYDGIALALIDDLSRGDDVRTVAQNDQRDEWDRLAKVTPEQVRAAFAKWVRPYGFVRADIIPPRAGS